MVNIKTITSLLTVVILLIFTSSCISWQTGERLRAQYAVYTGLDTDHPVDGKVYYYAMNGNQLPENCYVLAPEVNYHKDIPICKDVSGLYRQPKEEACHVRPTGRVVPVILRRDSRGNYVFERSLTALPKGLIADDAAISPLLAQARENARQEGNKQHVIPAEHGGTANPQLSQPRLGRRILITGCVYVVDPLLSVISTPVVWGYHIVTLPYSFIKVITD